MKSIDEMRKSYNSFIERQRVGYEMTAAMIGYIVEKMQRANIVSGNVSVSGRIKSFKSAYENTGKKAVDDCFGIRIIGPMEDLKKIQAEIEKNFKVDATKDHSRKANSSYNAIHEMLHMHAKCLYGELSYANYKSKDLIAISERLENDRENVLSDLPVFYTIEGNKIKRLSKQDSLYKMYPEIKRIEEGKRQGEEAAI